MEVEFFTFLYLFFDVSSNRALFLSSLKKEPHSLLKTRFFDKLKVPPFGGTFYLHHNTLPKPRPEVKTD